MDELLDVDMDSAAIMAIVSSLRAFCTTHTIRVIPIRICKPKEEELRLRRFRRRV
jgi:hypothetical protein